MSFWSGLFNGKPSISANNQAAEYTRNAINAGTAAANAEAKTGYDTATSRYQPYLAGGQRGMEMYNDAIGVNGSGGYQNALANFNADPFRAGEQDATDRSIRNTFRMYNGRGMGNSGAAGAAVGRVASDRYSAQVADYRNRLSGVGQQGYGAAGAQAGLDTGYYGGQADRAIGQQNALAANYSQMTAGNNAARNQGQQNFFNGLGAVGGLAFKAFAPGAGGVSMAGNIKNAFSSGESAPVGPYGTYGQSWQSMTR